MKNAIIIHGRPGKEEYYSPDFPSASNYHWIPWLQKQLLINDIKADTPEMPHAYLPEYSVWKREFERFDVTPETILVGHSTGAGFIVRWLSENLKVKVDKVILVAPYLDPESKAENDFFDFDIDTNLIARTKEVTIFNSDNDMDSIQKTVSKLRETVSDITYVEFQDYGHFTHLDMKTEAFPELLEEILK